MYSNVARMIRDAEGSSNASTSARRLVAATVLMSIVFAVCRDLAAFYISMHSEDNVSYGE